MKMLPDNYHYVNEAKVKRGLAHVVPNSACIECRQPEAMQKLMESLAQAFRIYQWRKDDGLRFDSDGWDLFFWCNDLWNTTGGKEHGRDLTYVRLNTNGRKTIAERMADYDRLRAFLAAWPDDSISVRFTYTSEDDYEAMKAEGQRILADIAEGQVVTWHGRRGRVRYSDSCHEYYFMELRKRKYGYRLDWGAICEIEIPAA